MTDLDSSYNLHDGHLHSPPPSLPPSRKTHRRKRGARRLVSSENNSSSSSSSSSEDSQSPRCVAESERSAMVFYGKDVHGKRMSPQALAPLPIFGNDDDDDDDDVSATSSHQPSVFKRRDSLTTNKYSDECSSRYNHNHDRDEDESNDENDEDYFDPETMPAPPTRSTLPPHRQFHRRGTPQSPPISNPKYELGQGVCHPIDMITEANEESAILAVASQLRPLDGAFVRRSGGRWCYAILAEKIHNDNYSTNHKEKDFDSCTLRFVVDERGSTKTIASYKWGEYVRLVREPVEAHFLLKKLRMRIENNYGSKSCCKGDGGDNNIRNNSSSRGKGAMKKAKSARSVLETLSGKDKWFDLMDPCTW